ncbi:hypothetical protein SADUNF_Sadunf02G0049800 [Salix dunnii]|uniref:Pentatricopeptide repeat-containing protein n=1 Tax=Salix dunnii TaxID=1413687 RepID=A0A835TGC4_9ROSI|nr:hypothetical protein SADUNF_Sadunf02G0049800 [Salix dunnii]
MIIGLAKCREVDNSWRLFDNMVLRRTVSWNSMISRYVGKVRFFEATDLFRRTIEERISLGSLHCFDKDLRVCESALKKALSCLAMNDREVEAVQLFSMLESSNCKPDRAINGEVHELVARGRLHPTPKEIYHESDDLGRVSMAMEQDCYEPIKIVVSCALYHDFKWVLRVPWILNLPLF